MGGVLLNFALMTLFRENMQAQPLSTNPMNRHRRTMIPMVVFLLLWGIWAYATHSHHDESLGSNTECQFCQFGTHSSAALPAIRSLPIPIVLETISDTFSEITFIALQIRAHDARAPPFVS
jgi:hypothetical protein